MTMLRLIVTGRVQGVGYRAFTVAQAHALGIEGWVRNRRDGSVEVLAAGDDKAVETLIAACRRGPRFAEVADIAVAPADEPQPHGFIERPTL